MIGVRRVWRWLIAAVLAAVLAAAGGVWILENTAARPWKRGEQSKAVVIPAGYGLGEIGNLLEREGVIRSGLVFQWYAWTRRLHGRLQAGEYELDPGLSIADIADRLARGQVRPQGIQVTIPEGTALEDLVVRFQSVGLPQAHALSEETIERWRRDFTFLPEAPLRSLEGYLFPDTYRFLPDVSADDITAKLLATFERRVLTLETQESLKRSGRTLDQVIILASMLEREVRSDEDQQLVAGVLWKRLDAHMPLQVDAAIAYAIGKKTSALTSADLSFDSPYNTYRYKGLPIGPISNPGARAVKNALRPIGSPFWFYLSKPDGATVFSKTAADHEAAVQQYLRR